MRALPEPEAVYPRLLSAESCCPPEDSGGLWGYAEYLEAMADPDHECHAEMVEWYGPDFDPNAVDKTTIRKQLNRLIPRRKTKSTAADPTCSRQPTYTDPPASGDLAAGRAG